MSTKLIKLKNGEEFIANVVKGDEEGIEIKNPLVLRNDPREGPVWLPWLALADKTKPVPIPAGDLLIVIEAEPKAKKAYEATTSNIDMSASNEDKKILLV